MASDNDKNFRLEWLKDEGFLYSGLGYHYIGRPPRGDEFCGYIMEKLQTETRSAFSLLGSGVSMFYTFSY